MPSKTSLTSLMLCFCKVLVRNAISSLLPLASSNAVLTMRFHFKSMVQKGRFIQSSHGKQQGRSFTELGHEDLPAFDVFGNEMQLFKLGLSRYGSVRGSDVKEAPLWTGRAARFWAIYPLLFELEGRRCAQVIRSRELNNGNLYGGRAERGNISVDHLIVMACR